MEVGAAPGPDHAIAEAPVRGDAVYRTLVDVLTEGVVVQGSDGSIQACNASADRILGLTRDQMAGRTSMDPPSGAWSTRTGPLPGRDTSGDGHAADR